MKSLYNYYKDVLKEPHWKYYDSQNWSIEPCAILGDNSAAKDFIHSIISAGKKESDKICTLIDNLELPRARHIVSTYLLGITLYQVPQIRNYINIQLNRFETKDKNLNRRFLYIWFLICFFHDLGYAYELGNFSVPKDLKKPLIYKRNKKLNMLPDIYDTDIVNKYREYRLRCMCINDHGIIGGMVIYKELIQKLSPREDIVKVLKAISNIIMVHNIFFEKKTGRNARCYYHYGLETLLYEGNRCRRINLIDNPLLFLFDLVDSIEPLKSLSIDDLKDVLLGYSNELEIYIPNKPNYKKCIRSINSWLTDVKIEKSTNLIRIKIC